MPGGRGRGGRRTGKVGTAYKNRTDLNGAQPVRAATGQAYGEAGAQADAQRAVPMGTPAVAAAGPAPGPAQFTGRPEGLAKPGSLGDLFAESTNPNEHVMSGAPMGPGPGPEAFGFGAQADMDADREKLARWLPALEAIANRPTATSTTRRLVRAIKGQVSTTTRNSG